MTVMEHKYYENYGVYRELVDTGYQTINTSSINEANIDDHFRWIINIMSDGIETDEVQNMKLHVVFPDDDVNLYIIQYMYNLMFWTLIVCAGKPIMSFHLFFEDVITKGNIKAYVDNQFVRRNIKIMDIMKMNQTIDKCIGKFRDLRNFQQYLCNTLDIKDTTDFMGEFPEFNKIIHTDISGVPMEDIKEYGMTATNKMIKYITRADRDHADKYSFISKEGTNAKQFKEVMVNIGTKPNGQGGVFQRAIPTSFVNGGLQTIEDVLIDSSIGRIAQILQKQNVGQSGAFARNLGLNNQDTKFHDDPEYICDTVNFEKVTIKNKDILDMYDLRYYRFKEDGVERMLDARKDKHLIGQTLYFRSPMTCASAARGQGVCYRCYGELAHANQYVNIGQIAAELLSAIYTQTLLSAKHLLESAIIKLEWTQEFSKFFNVEFDQIMLKDDESFKKYKLVIEEDAIISDDSDEDDEVSIDERYYIYSFAIRSPKGDTVVIKTATDDTIYIHQDLISIMNEEDTVDGRYEINMEKLTGISLFMVDVQNNELSAVMRRVKNLIDNKSSIKSHDRNSILEAFIDANLSGHIKLNAVHFEILLMNQIRSKDDILERPDWSVHNQTYQIIALTKSLSENPSISVRLQSAKLKNTLISPSNRKLYKTSNMDLFAMVHPQDFMSTDFKPSDPQWQDRKIVKPLIFNQGQPEETDTKDDEEDED